MKISCSWDDDYQSTADFLFPLGGIMSVTQSWYIDVSRLTLSSSMCSLGQIGQCIFEM